MSFLAILEARFPSWQLLDCLPLILEFRTKMGLDIYQEHHKTGREVDYFRFNWTACSDFIDWCKENGLPNPFPNWKGGNDGDMFNLGDRTNRQKARDWLKAYKERFPDDYSLGVGEAMRAIMFRVADSGRETDEQFYRKEFLDWDRNTALAWSWFLRSGLRKKVIIRYW